MTQYPCANTQCPNQAWVKKPGEYCNHPNCQREKHVQSAVDKLMELEKKESRVKKSRKDWKR